MLCARECPDWCIYIEGHKTLAPPRRDGGKPRSVNELDRFDIDYSLCMYCGICVEVCPFEALFWSPEFEYSELKIADLLHDKSRLGQWMETVPDFEAYESGSEAKVSKVPAPVAEGPAMTAARRPASRARTRLDHLAELRHPGERGVRRRGRVHGLRRASGWSPPTTSCTPRCG